MSSIVCANIIDTEKTFLKLLYCEIHFTGFKKVRPPSVAFKRTQIYNGPPMNNETFIIHAAFLYLHIYKK